MCKEICTSSSTCMACEQREQWLAELDALGLSASVDELIAHYRKAPPKALLHQDTAYLKGLIVSLTHELPHKLIGIDDGLPWATNIPDKGLYAERYIQGINDGMAIESMMA